MAAAPTLLAAALLPACFGHDPDRQPRPDAGVVTVYDFCTGDNDGLIERDEVVYVEGIEVLCRVNAPGTTVELDTAPAAGPGGKLRWDFSGMGDSDFTVLYDDIDGKWFETSFPGADMVMPVDHLSDLLGAYALSDDSLDLYGAASAGEGRVLLPYTEPVPVLRFPLRSGSAWTASTSVRDGVADGVPVASDETYAFEVVREGEMRLGPFLFKKTLLLEVRLDQVFPGGTQATTWQYIWLHECYGEIARATTQEPPSGSVIRAKEFRRIEVAM